MLEIGVLEKHPERLVAAVDSAREGGYEFVRFELQPKGKPGGTAPSTWPNASSLIRLLLHVPPVILSYAVGQIAGALWADAADW